MPEPGCSCCNEPPCPTPILEFRSVVSTRTKCGVLHEDKYWRSHVTTYNFIPGEPCDCDTELYSSVPSYFDFLAKTTATWDDDCIRTDESVTESRLFGYGCWDSEDPPNGYPCCQPSGGPPECGQAGETEHEYSDEYTTEELIEKVLEDIGTYEGEWNPTFYVPGDIFGQVNAFSTLYPDESNYLVARAEWRIRHLPTGSCYLKIWLERRVIDEEGETIGSPEIIPYEWTGSGNPCLPSPNKPCDHEDNYLTGPVTEEVEPGSPGENKATLIRIVKWSCVEGYEPPDDGTANGYPVHE